MKDNEKIIRYIILGVLFLLIVKPSLLFYLFLFVVPVIIFFISSKNNNLDFKFSGLKDGKPYYTPKNFNEIFNQLLPKNMQTSIKKSTTAIFIVVIAIIIIAKSIVIVPAGETGVYHLFGKVRDQEVRSGFHLVNPLAQVTKMSIRTEQYTMSIAQGEGQKIGDDSIDALTSEGLTMKLDITVFYHLVEDSASDVFRDLGTNYQEKIIRPEIRSAIREVVAGYDSKSIYSDKRDEIIITIKQKMVNNIEPRGIAIEQVLLRNVILPQKLDASIQEKLQAEQESQRYDFILEKEKKEADRKRIEAEGQRDAQKTINESLTSEYLNYLYIKELKDREGTIYVPTNPDNGMPMFKGIQ